MSETSQAVENRQKRVDRLQLAIDVAFVLYLLQQLLGLYALVDTTGFRRSSPSFLVIAGLLVGVPLQVLGAWIVRSLALVLVDWFDAWWKGRE